MKKFIADPSFWELFPDAAIGVLTVKDVSEGAQLAPEQAAEVAVHALSFLVYTIWLLFSRRIPATACPSIHS